MDAAKIFLTIVAVVYLVFAIWCSVKPETTAASLGLRLDPGSGQSEYLTVYGGFQLALALLFLWPWIQAESLPYSLLACVVIHGCLVLMRTVGFVLYSGIRPATFLFAASEWIVLLGAAAIWWWRRSV